jgi:23S rRNA pseudouridine1911/1915/1917 synthase
MKNIKEQFILTEEHEGLRLDQVLAKLMPEYSRSQSKPWIIAGNVLLNGEKLRPRDKVSEGQTLSIDVSLESETDWEAQAIDLDIVDEDEHLIIINKQAGLVVHPGAGNPNGTMINALLAHAPQLKTLPRCGIVHRIDKDTTGLLVVVKTELAHTQLTKQLQTHAMGREYEAIAKGIIIAGGTVDAPIDRHPRSRIKMATHPSGKHAVSHYRVIERFRQHTHLRVNLETGRTHQIRVHLEHILHPLLGDPVYGTNKQLPAHNSQECRAVLGTFKRQALHARKLSLTHPATGDICEWEAPLPDDMVTVLKALKEDTVEMDYYKG